jgi:hypothetical protein
VIIARNSKKNRKRQVEPHAYEREAMEEHMKRNGYPYPRSPLLNQRLSVRKGLTEAVDIKERISEVLQANPALKKDQYLSLALTKAMREACKVGDTAKIRALVQQDERLLIRDPETEAFVFHQAIEDEASLSTVVELLEKHRPGLALMILQQPVNIECQHLLEVALCSGRPSTTLLKLMRWMGDSLSSFHPTEALLPQAQSTLNKLLRACVLLKNSTLVDHVLSWGARADAQMLEQIEALKQAAQPVSADDSLAVSLSVENVSEPPAPPELVELLPLTPQPVDTERESKQRDEKSAKEIARIGFLEGLQRRQERAVTPMQKSIEVEAAPSFAGA